jgi:hypothetical protein
MTPAARLRDGFECVLPVLHTTPYLTNFFLQIANTFFFKFNHLFLMASLTLESAGV